MKQQIAELFNRRINDVENSFPSLYSKQDVLQVLTELAGNIAAIPDAAIDSGSLDAFIKEITDEVRDEIESYDYDGATELDLDYNKTINVEVDTRDLVRHTRDRIDQVYAAYKDRIGQPQEVEAD
jgi:hypothetical protein